MPKSFKNQDLRQDGRCWQHFDEVDCRYADFSGANLSGLDLHGMLLEGANFTGAVIQNTIFDGSYMLATTFENTDLFCSSLYNCKLPKAIFKDCDLRGVDFRINPTGASGLDISTCKLDGMKVTSYDHSNKFNWWGGKFDKYYDDGFYAAGKPPVAVYTADGVIIDGPTCQETLTVPRTECRPVVLTVPSSDTRLIAETDPVDGLVCPACDFGFKVSQLEHDDSYFENLDVEGDFTPAFCPQCGHRIEVSTVEPKSA